MLQAAILDCGLFDPFSFQQDGLSAAEVNVGRRDIVQAFVIAAMVVVIDEGVDSGYQVAGQIVVFQQDAVRNVSTILRQSSFVFRLARQAGGSVD